MALASCAGIVEVLTQLELLDAGQLQELARLQLRFTDPAELVGEMVQWQWLTEYQANLVLRERGHLLVLGPFVLLERLGEGGMGLVYKARHRPLGRVQAVKVIRKDALANPVAVPRFEREVRAAAKLLHPNVVRAFDAGQANGTYYLAMEFIDGIDLFQLVKQSGPLPVPQACDYLRQAALGLQHAHEAGFIHRDIKPANLIVTRKLSASRAGSGMIPRPGGSAVLARPALDEYPWGLVKILDFGLARLADPEIVPGQIPLSQLGSVMGTPDFVAPEQAWDAHTLDVRGDLYSLGCTFYWLLSGRVPFPTGTLPEKLVQHRAKEPQPVELARRQRLLEGDDPPAAALPDSADVPAEVVAVVQRLMRKLPGERYQTPGELVEALDGLACRKCLPSAATPTPPPRRLPASLVRGGRSEPVEHRAGTTVILAPRAGKPQQTAVAPPPARSPIARKMRGLLVCAGVALCCTLSGRLVSNNLPRADHMQKPPVIAQDVKENGQVGLARPSTE